MDKRVIIFIVSLLILAASIEWISRLFQEDLPLQNSPVSQENSIENPSNQQDGDIPPAVGGEIAPPSETPVTKQLTLPEIKAELEKIQEKTEILSLQVEALVIKEKLRQARLASINAELLNVQEQVNILANQVALLINSQTAAGASQKMILSEDPVLP